MDTLWQRFGRAARDLARKGLAILFVDAKLFDEEREEAARRAEKRKEAAARKAMEKEQKKRRRPGQPEHDDSVSGGTGNARKRARTGKQQTENILTDVELQNGPVADEAERDQG